MGNTVSRSHIRDADRGVAKATRDNTRRNSVPPPLPLSSSDSQSLFPYPQYPFPSLPPPSLPEVSSSEQSSSNPAFPYNRSFQHDSNQHEEQEDFRFHSRTRSQAALEAVNAVNAVTSKQDNPQEQQSEEKEDQLSSPNIKPDSQTLLRLDNNLVSKMNSNASRDTISEAPPSLHLRDDDISEKKSNQPDEDDDSQLSLINSRRANLPSAATDPIPDRIHFHPTLSGSYRRNNASGNLTKRRQRHVSAEIAFSRRSSDPARSAQPNQTLTAINRITDMAPSDELSRPTLHTSRFEGQRLTRDDVRPLSHPNTRPPRSPLSPIQPIDELLRGWDTSTRRPHPPMNRSLEQQQQHFSLASSNNLALRRAALVDPTLTGASVSEAQAARTHAPPRVDKPPRARKVVSFNENVHVVTYPYESNGSPHSSTTEFPALTRYPEHKIARKRSRSVLRLLSKVAAANYLDGAPMNATTPQATLTNPSHEHFAQHYDACCGLHVNGETEVVYDELSSAKGYEETEVYTGLMGEEGRLLSFDSSKDLLDESYINPGHQRAPNFYYPSSSSRDRERDRAAYVPLQPEKDTIDDDFDYTEKYGSDDGTLSFSDAHPSCDGIDEPEAIGDQLLSPDKEVAQDARIAPSFDIAPLWQRLKRVDELDAVTRSRRNVLSKDAASRLENLARKQRPRYSGPSASNIPKPASVSSTSSSISPPAVNSQSRVSHTLSQPQNYMSISNRFPHLRQPLSPDPSSSTTLPEYLSSIRSRNQDGTQEPTPRMLPKPSGTSSATTKAAKDRRIVSEPLSPTNFSQVGLNRSRSSTQRTVSAVPGSSSTRGNSPKPWPMPDRAVVSLSKAPSIPHSPTQKPNKKKTDQEDKSDSPTTSKHSNFEFWEERVDAEEKKATEEKAASTSLVSEEKTQDTRIVPDVITSDEAKREEPVEETREIETDTEEDMVVDDKTADETKEESDDHKLDNKADDVVVETESVESLTDEISPVTKIATESEPKEDKEEVTGFVDDSAEESPSTDVEEVKSEVLPKQKVTPKPVEEEPLSKLEEKTRQLSSTKSEEIIPRHVDSLNDQMVTRRVQSQSVDARSVLEKGLADAFYINNPAFSLQTSLFDDNELTAAANDLVASELRPLSPSIDGNGSDHDMDPGNLTSNNQYAITPCSPVRNTAPLACVFYGNSSSGSMSPSADCSDDGGGISDYPEYEVLNVATKEDSVFGSEPHTPVINARPKWESPFEAQLQNEENVAHEALASEVETPVEDRDSKVLPEVLLHDWSGNTPVEPNVEMVDSAPSSKRSNSTVFSATRISKDTRQEFSDAATVLANKLKLEPSARYTNNEDRAEAESLANTKEEGGSSIPITAMTKTGDFAGVVGHFPNVGPSTPTSQRSKSNSNSIRQREDSETTNGTHKEASTQTAETWGVTGQRIEDRSRQKSTGIESDSGRPPSLRLAGKSVSYAVDPKYSEFQINVERKSFSEAGYRRPIRALRGASFMEGEMREKERDRMAEPITESKGSSRDVGKDRMRRLGLPPRRRRLSNMETSSGTREDGSGSRSVVGRLVNGMNIAKRLVSPN